MKKEIYVSIDIETNGRIPGPHSMLSLGAVALQEDGTEISTWYANLLPLEGAGEDAKTMEFWRQHQAFYDATQVDQQSPESAMHGFRDWLLALPGTPVAVAHPAGFDFTWVYWYLIKFTGESPVSFSCVDMKTMVMMITGNLYRHSTKRNWPRSWFHPTIHHNHHALTDAREQAYSFIQMLQAAKALRGNK